jgi:hypothetical protein
MRGGLAQRPRRQVGGDKHLSEWFTGLGLRQSRLSGGPFAYALPYPAAATEKNLPIEKGWM